MSFVFRKPVPQPRSISSDFDLDNNHYELLYKRPEPDYDELLIRLSLYAFNRLSPGDQEEQVEKIRQNVNVEDVEEQSDESEAFRLRTFAELFNKLNFSEQRRFLFTVAKKFKREKRLGELMSSFQQLDAKHQQQVIERIVHVTPENLRNPGEKEEELRLRRFTQLSRDYTDHVYKLVVAWKSDQDEQEETSDNENGSDCFAEFFLGFSIVWFQGQSSINQDLLIEQLSHGVRRTSVVIKNRLPHESEENFKLRRFTELCKQVVDFGVQEKFLDNAQEKLEIWQSHYSYRWIVEPQDSDSAVELLSLLTCFGFSLLSAMYQQRMIDEMSNQVEGVEIKTSPAAAAQEDEELEGIRMTRFRQLFNQVPGPKRTDIFEHFRSIFYQGHHYSQLNRFFRRLDSKDQAELIDNMFNNITKVDPWEEWDSAQLIMEKFWGESEEEFRLRRFENMCIKRLHTCKHFVEDEAEERVLQLYRTSESDHNYHQESCYAEFLFGVSVIWYKARCANYRRNPVQLILFGEVELGDTIEKLAEESEEDFRLKRFTESFKQLELTSQVRIADYIQGTLFRDLAYPVSGPQPDLVSSNGSSNSGSHSDFDELSLKSEPDLVSRNGSSNSGSHSDFDELSLKSEPDLVSRNGSSNSASHSDFDELFWKWEPDYDELLIRLSHYAFNRLSSSDQREQVEEIRRNVDVVEDVQQRPEESNEAFRLRTFAELFNKLNFSNQNKLFLSKVIQKFKHERQLGELMSSFQQLDANHQQQVIEKIVHVTPENLRNPWETEEELRLRRFTQLSRDYTDHVYKLVVAWKDTEQQEETSDNDNGSDWKSCFADFFLGFSIVWFQGQSSSGQDMLIEKLSKGVTGVVIEQTLQESEEDFKLRRFTELCKKIVDFRVQMEFLNYAKEKLRTWRCDHFSWSSILEPQEHDRAAELLSDISTLGCSLLSAKYQRQKIEEMSNLVEGDTVTIIEESSDDDHFRMTIFTELFNQVPVRTRIDLFKELRKMLMHEKLYSEVVPFFMGLGSEDQTEMIEKLLDEIMKYPRKKCDPAELIVEKFSGESEEDFRLRRFKKVCSKHLSVWGQIVWPEADEERVREATSDNYKESRYAKFLFDVSITWFKARCANYRRNPIHVILFSQVEFRHVIEKLPEESEEEFKLRRFTESFKQLEFTSQVRFVDCIQYTLFGDLGCPVSYMKVKAAWQTYEGRGPFDPKWIKMKLPDLRDQGAAAATTQGATTTTSQAGGGGGGGQGTGQP